MGRFIYNKDTVIDLIEMSHNYFWVDVDDFPVGRKKYTDVAWSTVASRTP